MIQTLSASILFFSPFLLAGICLYTLFLLSRERQLKENMSKDASLILSKAEKQAEKLLSHIEYDRKEMETRLQSEIIKAVNMEREEFIQSLSALHDEMMKEAKKSLSTLSEYMASEKTSGATLLKEKIDGEYEQVKKELEEYKKQKMDTLQEELEKKLDKLTWSILKKTLSKTEKEKLVFEALEKAKEENFFASLVTL